MKPLVPGRSPSPSRPVNSDLEKGWPPDGTSAGLTIDIAPEPWDVAREESGLDNMTEGAYSRSMATPTPGDFEDLLGQIEREAEEDGPAGIADLRALQFKYQMINELILRRRELRWTQQQLAEHSGIAQTAISKIERGRKSPTIDTYARLLTALELSPTWARRSAERASQPA